MIIARKILLVSHIKSVIIFATHGGIFRDFQTGNLRAKYIEKKLWDTGQRDSGTGEGFMYKFNIISSLSALLSLCPAVAIRRIKNISYFFLIFLIDEKKL